MSVLDRRYRRWEGVPTPYARRVLAVPRYAFAALVARRIVLLLWVVMLVPPLLLGALVFVAANVKTFSQGLPWIQQVPFAQLLGPETFSVFARIQLNAAVVLALVAGPRLISSDVAGGALPLYFSKVLRRRDYLVGKAAVLLVLLSSVTWIPLALVVGLRQALGVAPDGQGWLLAAVIGVPLAFIAFLTVLTCAISAHVKRAWLAPFMLLGILFSTAALGATLDTITGTRLGSLASPVLATASLHDSAFAGPARDVTRRPRARAALPAPVAAAALAAWTLGAGVMLVRRIQPVEVVR